MTPISLPSLRGLQALLPPPRRFEDALAGVTHPVAGRGTRQWVLSRVHYRHARFEMGPLPRQRREQALALRIRQWSPFPRTGHVAVWQEDEAQVWAWDAERLDAELAKHGLRAGQLEVIPETLLHPKHEQGVFLHACLDGFEAQYWREGTLVCSRWWAKAPATEQWLGFQRDAGVALELQVAEVPAPAGQAWESQPWAGRDGVGVGMLLGGSREAMVVVAGAAVLAVASSWYLVSWARLHYEQMGIQAELKSLAPSVQPTQIARSGALDALGRVDALKSLDLFPDQLSLLAKAAERLVPFKATLKEWDYRSGKLRMSLATTLQAPTSDYVKAFQVPDLFDNVQVVPSGDPGTLVLTMDVVANAKIAFAEGQAGVTGK